MPGMRILLNAEDMAKEKNLDRLIHIKNMITVGALEGGMESGKASVAFMFDLPSGETVIAETSLALFVAAARAFVARYGDPNV